MTSLSAPLKTRLRTLIPGYDSLELRLFLDNNTDLPVSVGEIILLALENATTIKSITPVEQPDAETILVLFAEVLAGLANNTNTRNNARPPRWEPSPADFASFFALFPQQAPQITARLVNHPDTRTRQEFQEYCETQHLLEHQSPTLDEAERNYGRMKLLVDSMMMGVAA